MPNIFGRQESIPVTEITKSCPQVTATVSAKIRKWNVVTQSHSQMPIMQ